MREDFLHFLWQYQYFDKNDLRTTENNSVNILKTGHLNKDAGPDFREAKVNIDDIDWSGSVEIHIKSSDWNLHNHQNDRAYENVVLHVVWQHDYEIKRSDGTTIPTIELKEIADPQLQYNYIRLINSHDDVACHNKLDEVPDIVKLSMIDKAVTDRLISKAQNVVLLQQQNSNDWNETAYQLLSSNFGFKVNTEAFLELSKSLPFKLILKHRDNLNHMESLLFGQAGFLEEESGDEYYQARKKEYEFFKHKYNLNQKLDRFQWKFLRLRPANFPTVRIAQLAALIYKIDKLFATLTGSGSVDKLTNILKVKQSEYWLEHYDFEKQPSRKMTNIGKASCHNIIINTAIPMLVAYSRQIDDQAYLDRAVALLQQLPAENNVIIRKWKSLGLKPDSSFDTQGLIQLNNEFCLKRRCLSCNIGTTLVRKT